MARRTSFSKLVSDMARAQARAERERARQQAATNRATIKRQKQAATEYYASRVEYVNDQNELLGETIEALKRLLQHTFDIDDSISFESLHRTDVFPPPPNIESYTSEIKKPGGLSKLVPGADAKYQKALQEATQQYEADLKKYNAEKSAFDKEFQEQYSEIEEFKNAYQQGEPLAVIAYNNMVLERSEYPEGFPQEFRVAYVPEPKELIIEYELPNTSIVPTVAEYKFVKARDAVDEKPRKATEIKELYQDIVASVCLRTIHEIFEADQGDHIQVVAFNGFVQSVDPATGRDIRPYLISVRTTKEKFNEINLARVDKKACLRNLGAQVSPRPEEMQPVKPIVDFNMVDKRFVEQSDILGDLESRPNLMELNPFEFENLVSNLFEKIGFQAKLTRSSKDGGVDAIAYDPRPILGGKVVIQAKRYKNVVGVSAVRDLYGTMINEGANKGILVCTSHFGPDAYEFSKDKPIELIDGGGLLYLLEQNGVKARIVFPDD